MLHRDISIPVETTVTLLRIGRVKSLSEPDENGITRIVIDFERETPSASCYHHFSADPAGDNLRSARCSLGRVTWDPPGDGTIRGHGYIQGIPATIARGDYVWREPPLLGWKRE